MIDKIRILVALILSVFAAYVQAADAGKVCVQAIPAGARWDANDTGATERSVFKIQIDDRPGFCVATNSSGMFAELSMSSKHLVKIRLNGKLLTSFYFTFRGRSDHLRLWYNPFYGTWSLSDVRGKEWCACRKWRSQ